MRNIFNLLCCILCNITILSGAPNAAQLLNPSNHIQVAEVYGSNEFNGKLFNDQIAAIEVSGQAGKPEDIHTLIPFLDYPGEGAYAMLSVHAATPPDLIADIKYWPAFAAIAKIPHSGEALASYILDENNPLDYRLTALVVLKVMSKDIFDQCVAKLHKKYEYNPKMWNYVLLLQSPIYGFRGSIIDHERLDAALKLHQNLH